MRLESKKFAPDAKLGDLGNNGRQHRKEWEDILEKERKIALLNKERLEQLQNVSLSEKEKFLNSLTQLQEIIANMIERGDPDLYSFKGKYTDEKIEKFNLYIRQYLGTIQEKQRNLVMDIVPHNYSRCGYCNQHKKPDEFYTAYHTGKKTQMVFCKNCCSELFTKFFKTTKDIRESVVMFSSMVNILVHGRAIERLYDMKDSKEGKESFYTKGIVGSYLDILWKICDEESIPSNQRLFMYSNFGNMPFNDVETLAISQVYDSDSPAKKTPVTSSQSKVEEEEVDSPVDGNDYLAVYDKDEIKKIPYFKGMRNKRIELTLLEWEKKWGTYTPTELWFLEEKYAEWNESYEISDLSREKLVKQLCYEELAIFECRQQGEKVSDRIKNFRELMRDSDLTPRKKPLTKEEEKNKGMVIKNVGELIRFAEKNKPIIVRDDSLWDVDNMRTLWQSIAGAISRTRGLDSPYTRVFEKTFAEHTVNIQELANELETSSGKDDE